MAHLDLGRLLFNKVKQELFLVSKVERDAKMEGRRMTLVLQPDHKNPATAKAPQLQTTPGVPRSSAPMNAGQGLNIPQRAATTPPPAQAPAAQRPPAAPPAPRPAPQPVGQS
jgi:hypothetical protein